MTTYRISFTLHSPDDHMIRLVGQMRKQFDQLRPVAARNTTNTEDTWSLYLHIPAQGTLNALSRAISCVRQCEVQEFGSGHSTFATDHLNVTVTQGLQRRAKPVLRANYGALGT